MKSSHAATIAAALVLTCAAPALAQVSTAEPSFLTTLSNITPLTFGMDADAAAAVLGPLTYVSGTPGNEVYVVIRKINGHGFGFRDDPLYLQFRRGRLTGWKGDWDRRWMW